MDQINELTEIDTKKKIREFIKTHFLLGNDSKLKDEDSFMEKGVVDSTGILEIVSFVEETFSFKIFDEELLPENLDSINNLSVFIHKKQGQTT